MADWNGFKKNGTPYIPNDATARAGVIANTKLIKDSLGWSGKNKLPMTLSDIKAINTGAVWNGNEYTLYGVTYTVNLDGQGNVASIKVHGIPTATSILNLYTANGDATKYNGKILNGFSGGASGYGIRISDRQVTAVYNENGNTVISGLTNTGDIEVVIRVPSGTSVNNKLVYPMIRDADILDDTYEPYFGSTAFPRSEQAVLGAKNFALSDVLHFALAGSVGNSVFVANNDVIGFCAKVEKNTNYTWDYVDGDRYRLALSANYPVNNGACYIEYVNDTGVKKHTFNSGNYEYAYLYCYNNNDKTYEEIKPLCTLASDTDRTFVPPAMTNRELTVNKVNKARSSAVTTLSSIFSSYAKISSAYLVENDILVNLRVESTAECASGVWTNIGTLLDKYKPAALQYLVAIDNSNNNPFGIVRIQANGSVDVFHSTGSNKEAVFTTLYMKDEV